MYTPQRLVLDMKVVEYLKQFYLTENLFDYITTKSGVHDDIDLLKLKKTLQIYKSVFVILIKKIMSSLFLNYIINIVSIVITEILSFTLSIMFYGRAETVCPVSIHLYTGKCWVSVFGSAVCLVRRSVFCSIWSQN